MATVSCAFLFVAGTEILGNGKISVEFYSTPEGQPESVIVTDLNDLQFMTTTYTSSGTPRRHAPRRHAPLPCISSESTDNSVRRELFGEPVGQR